MLASLPVTFLRLTEAPEPKLSKVNGRRSWVCFELEKSFDSPPVKRYRESQVAVAPATITPSIPAPTLPSTRSTSRVVAPAAASAVTTTLTEPNLRTV